MKIAIVGAAGTLGSCAAFSILLKGIPGELWLFGNRNRNLLQAHFLDQQICAAVSSEMTLHVAESCEQLAGCDVVVITASAPWREVTNRMELLDDNLPVLRMLALEISKHCPQAIVINATNPVDPLNYAFHLLTGMDRLKLLGYSMNDSYRLRMYVARELGAKAINVDGLVIGEHGPHQVPLWSLLKVGGKPVAAPSQLREAVLSNIRKFLVSYESLRTGRTAGWISAVGIAEMVRAIVLDTGELFPCSIVLDGEYGRRGLSSGVLARVGRQGAVEIPCPVLAADEQEKLEASFDFLQQAGNLVRNMLALNESEIKGRVALRDSAGVPEECPGTSFSAASGT
jgi:malate/lactate dehydrogenase